MKISIFLFLLFAFCISEAQIKRRFNPESLQLAWRLKENLPNADSGFVCGVNFTNGENEIVPRSGWKIYFNIRYHGFSLKSLSTSFEIKHVNGDLFYLAPTLTFDGLQRNRSMEMDYRGLGRVANFQDMPSGLFWVYDDDPDRAITLNRIIITRSNEGNKNEGKISEPDAKAIFIENDKIPDIPSGRLPKIFPTPLEYHAMPGIFLLDKSLSISSDKSFLAEAGYLADEIQKLTGSRPLISSTTKSGKIIVLKKDLFAPESYRLEISRGMISISAADGAGIFYGIQSLKSILPRNAWTAVHPSIEIPCMEVTDAPQFPVREFMLDVARNFQPKREILKILDLMAMYKLNVFHFHLTDDEGWRLAIPGLPELTDIGARRGYPFNDYRQLHPSYGSGPQGGHSSGSGFYTKDEFIEILRYATFRHIQVIPEIESPGHARAAVISMINRFNKYVMTGDTIEAEKYLLNDPQDQSDYMSNQYFNDNVMNVALPSTYGFMEKVIDEIRDMYRTADAPLTMIHIGADEVPQGSWEKSPAVKELMNRDIFVSNTKDLWRKYFEKIKDLLKARGISMCGWEELAIGTQYADNSHNIKISTNFIEDKVRLDAWWNIFGNEDHGYRLANAGYQVVLSPVDYFYLDLAYNKSFDEPGDAWVGFLDLQKVFSFIPYDYYKNTRQDMTGNLLSEDYFKSREPLTGTGKKNIAGLQAAMWGENIATPELLEYMLLPRLLAMAERAWAKEPAWALEKVMDVSKENFQRDWSVFVNRLAKQELPKLDFYNGGYLYRIPTAGAVIRNGKVMANCGFPGFTIRYSTDESAPTNRSSYYSKPISVKGIINLRVFDSRGRSGQTTSIVNK